MSEGPGEAAGAKPARIAVVDGGSFVLPYDFHLVKSLAAAGFAVTFFGSRTRFNGEFLDAMRDIDGIEVRARGISGTVAPRWKGALAYLALWLELWRERHRYAAINLQFSALWPVERLVLPLLRKRLVYTVHNAVPHGQADATHGPTRRIAQWARTLVFVSAWSRDDFIARYGEVFRAKSVVAAHGVSPARPGDAVVPYTTAASASEEPPALVFWSTVKPYKGVELFADLARSPRLRALRIALEVHGRWDASLAGLKQELVDLGVTVDDRFLGLDGLAALLARDVVFLLPNREATQSGAMYTLLAHGRLFLAADAGDLGAFLRRHGLESLLLRERSADAVADALECLQRDRPAITAALQRAQDASAWSETTRGIAQAYGAVYIPPAP